MKRRAPVRILLVGFSLERGQGGIAVVARLMARVLGAWHAAQRCEVRALMLMPVSEPAEFGFAIHSARGQRARFLLQACRAAAWADGVIYDCANMARVHGFLPWKRPSLVYLHGVEVWENAKPAWIAACRRATYRVANSHYTQARCARLHGLSDIEVCWLATEDAESHPAPLAPALAQRPAHVLILGRIALEEDYKGHCELIAAWPRILETVPDARLLIAGAGNGLARLRTRVAQSPAAGHIDVLGFVPEAEMDALFARVRVLAMPSRGEGFGLVYIEAMRRGIPVLASVHDAGQEVVVNGETGYCVDLQHPDELAAALLRLLREDQLLVQMADAARQRWQSHFCFARFEDRFSAVLDRFRMECS